MVIDKNCDMYNVQDDCRVIYFEKLMLCTADAEKVEYSNNCIVGVTVYSK